MVGSQILAATGEDRFAKAADVLSKATASGQVRSATIYVRQRDSVFSQHFGKANSVDAMFLLGSISKPICVTALMTLLDRGEFRLDDPLKKFIPQFTGEQRDRVTFQHLLTHVSGLPDQLPENSVLRKQHAGLSEFVEHAARTPLGFAPGTKYEYSSMGILLATSVAQLITGTNLLEFVDRAVFRPLGMKHSAQGLGRFTLDSVVACQTEFGAPESGAGDPSAKEWDWNSKFWRTLGAPWGGTHASAPDLALFLTEFLHAQGKVVKPATAKQMIRNQNPPGLETRGLGFDVGTSVGTKGCSENTFGHTGSTGTIAWADPATETICVVLTSLPARAVDPHPRKLASEQISSAS